MKLQLSIMLAISVFTFINVQPAIAKYRVVDNEYVSISTSHDRVCKLERQGKDFYAYYLPEAGDVPPSETVSFSVSSKDGYKLTSEAAPSIAVDNSAPWSVSATVPEEKGSEGKIYVKAVTVTITPLRNDVEDGEDSTIFSCNIPFVSLSATYQWIADPEKGSWAPNAGKTAALDYSSALSKSTYVKGCKWFALPDKPWEDETPLKSTYAIDCEVSIDDVKGRPKNKALLMVEVPYKWGVAFSPTVTDVDTIEISADKIDGAYRVIGSGTFKRTEPTNYTVFLHARSQFLEKATAHEVRHLTQWRSMAPWKDYWNANQWYNDSIKDMSDPDSRENLKRSINDFVVIMRNLDKTRDENNAIQAEEDAFTISNLKPPLYLNVKMENVSKKCSQKSSDE